ncbi:MAG: helix-turn-helix transcriptional regulator [Hungatella sp.]|jgi:DNA-binding XRE family transcriptional regulator|nr:helix-turn-helix transcriptional regulator [Hungatella sp.]
MIKENRNKKGYTQEELAELIGISWRQLQRIEKHEEQTKITTLKKLIKILDIPDKEILRFMKKVD